MWRLLQNAIPEKLRAEIESRIVARSWSQLGDRATEPEEVLDGFFTESRGNGELLQQLLELPDAQALMRERLVDPVVYEVAPLLKLPGAPATQYRDESRSWRGMGQPPARFVLWYAITATTVGNGCPRIASPTAEADRTALQTTSMSTLDLARSSIPTQDVAMRAGQVLLLDATQLHGAYPNHSNKARIALRVLLGSKVAGTQYHAIGDFGSAGMVARSGWRRLFSSD